MDYRSTQATNRAPKVLMVGDSGVGKTTFVASLNRQLRNGASPSGDNRQPTRSPPPTSSPPQSTIGLRCDSICVKYGGAVKAIDVIELGGNRTFHRNSRSAAYKIPYAAVLLFYRPDSPESIIAMGHWYEELKKELSMSAASTGAYASPSPQRFYGSPSLGMAQPARNPVKLVIVESCSSSTDDSWNHTNQKSLSTERSSVLDGTAAEPAHELVQKATRYFWHWLTIFLSILLFGPGQKAVPYKLSDPQDVLRAIECDPNYSQTIRVEYSGKEQKFVFNEVLGDIVQLFVTLSPE